jgi:uncharacterized protein (DUF1800 family)
LRAGDWELRPFLRRLFTDPRFYREEIVGARVLSPLEFMAGSARRADVGASAVVIGAGASLLGQRLYHPPSVKGWDEGWAWISTSTLMQRGNLAGFLLGVVRLDEVTSVADVEAEMAADAARESAARATSMEGGAMQDGEAGDRPMKDAAEEPAMRPAADAPADAKPKPKPKPRAGSASMELLRRADTAGWLPTYNLRLRLQRNGAVTDAEIVDRLLADLLAVRAAQDTRGRLLEYLSGERAKHGIEPGLLLESDREAERILRRLAHLILSLPEAQLG